jgi:hypothetical protein
MILKDEMAAHTHRIAAQQGLIESLEKEKARAQARAEMLEGQVCQLGSGLGRLCNG